VSAIATYPDSLRRWNLASWILLALYVLSLLAFAVSVFDEDFVRAIGLGGYADEKSWWPILVQVALGTAAFLTYYWPRRRAGRNFSVLVTGALAATTVSIGLVAYWGCPSTASESTFWTPLTYALNLLVGNIQECDVGPDVRAAPLALQLPRCSARCSWSLPRSASSPRSFAHRATGSWSGSAARSLFWWD
jgi:hypothetical protein